jgi:hypothetical protein
MVMRFGCAWNALKVQTVLPPVLPRDLVEHDNARARHAPTRRPRFVAVTRPEPVARRGCGPRAPEPPPRGSAPARPSLRRTRVAVFSNHPSGRFLQASGEEINEYRGRGREYGLAPHIPGCSLRATPSPTRFRHLRASHGLHSAGEASPAQALRSQGTRPSPPARRVPHGRRR